MSLILDFVGDRLPPDLYDAYLTPLFETWSGVLVETSPPSGKVLDIACGTGIVARKLASQANVESVAAIDLAPPMIDKARQLTPPALPIAFQTASADKLPFADNQFSAAYCQQGLQFFPDRPAALKEAARAAAPGGRLTFAVWTAANAGNPVFGAFEDIVARELGADLVPFGPFSLGDKDAIAAAAREAGLQNISVERTERVTPLPDPRTLVLFDLLFLGRPGPDGDLQPLFDPADSSKDALIETLIAAVEDAARPFLQPDGTLRAPSAAHILVAHAPS